MHRISLFSIASLFVFSTSAALVAEGSASGFLVELKSQYSGKCLTVKGGSTAHGAGLMHKECGTGDGAAIWEMSPDGPGYRIVNNNSGLCLGVAHASKKDGKRLKQVAPCDRPDALWTVDGGIDYGRAVVIRNENSGKCLALVRGDEIRQYGCSSDQIGSRPKIAWQIIKVSELSDFKRIFVTSSGPDSFVPRRQITTPLISTKEESLMTRRFGGDV